MRKYFALSAVLVSAVVLSGCSIVPANNGAQSVDQKIPVSSSVWKSTDGGKTWSAKNIASAKPSATDWDILRIVVNPNDPNNVFVGLRNGGMMMSTDGGERWQPTIFTSEKVYGLELNPHDGQTVYASAVFNSRGKIFKSLDKGETWKEIYTSATEGPLVVAMKLDRNNPETVYAATSDNLLLKSRDGGGSWRNIYKSASPIIQIETDDENSNLLYLLDNSGNVSRSGNAGESFEKITPASSGFSFSPSGISAVRIDPVVGNGVYVAGSAGILRSADAGNTWEKVIALNDPANEPVTALAINPKDARKIVYGSAQAAYGSVDGGVNWTSFQFDVSKRIISLEYDPQNPDIIWAGFKK